MKQKLAILSEKSAAPPNIAMPKQMRAGIEYESK
jgi:hypothetical protein